MSSSDWSRLTMDHMRGCDWPMGDVHVMGTLLLELVQERVCMVKACLVHVHKEGYACHNHLLLCTQITTLTPK